MTPVIALNGLWIIPIATYFYVRHRSSRMTWVVTGATLGAVISPASSGLYGLGYLSSMYLSAVPWIGAILLTCISLPITLLGLIITTFHGEPGYSLAIKIGLIEGGKIVEGAASIRLEILTGAIWSAIYALVGTLIDFANARRKKGMLVGPRRTT